MTANGEVFDPEGLNAAHKYLPLPSYVKVTNLENKKSIIVRVNDRGPFVAGRIIDLSAGAAKKLGYYNKGTAKVLVETIKVENA
jgi:rare lipoprotein A